MAHEGEQEEIVWEARGFGVNGRFEPVFLSPMSLSGLTRVPRDRSISLYESGGLNGAIDVLRGRYPGREVRVVFPAVNPPNGQQQRSR